MDFYETRCEFIYMQDLCFDKLTELFALDKSRNADLLVSKLSERF